MRKEAQNCKKAKKVNQKGLNLLYGNAFNFFYMSVFSIVSTEEP